MFKLLALNSLFSSTKKLHSQDKIAQIDPRDEFIRRVVKGKSFIDVGGLSNVIYERVSVAAAFGAKSITMLDVEQIKCPWWPQLRERLTKKKCQLDCEFISADFLNVSLPKFDVVFSSGVLYHLPNPMSYVTRLRDITAEYCIVASTTVSQNVRTSIGNLKVLDSAVLFVPALDGREKRILTAWYKKHGRGDIAEPEEQFGGYRNLENYYPNWFVPTVSALRSILECGGFSIIDEAAVEPDDVSHVFLLKPR